eukprot:TRINITY_DN2443_c0_g2_i1.p2 TRINITY_DN2443_c0_g2~~TRINITY_DN2443_c0_g2_i1.p2  ORF type:complete len:121 (-),score=9.01 TRINITY_DN2443_c0_g2_i1:2-364(-)
MRGATRRASTGRTPRAYAATSATPSTAHSPAPPQPPAGCTATREHETGCARRNTCSSRLALVGNSHGKRRDRSITSSTSAASSAAPASSAAAPPRSILHAMCRQLSNCCVPAWRVCLMCA